MPEAFDLKYVKNDGSFGRPVMIHRAILGSFERYIGILTEHYQGAFPLWMNPVQVILIPITDRHLGFAEKSAEVLREAGIRTEVDDRSERLQAKIRDATLQKIPYLGIIGDKEIESNSISARTRDGLDLGVMEISEFLKRVEEEIEKKV
jgi:threonyl-tRNA synthetase